MTATATERPAGARPRAFDGRVDLGMRVRMTRPDGEPRWVRPVPPEDWRQDGERVLAASPVGAAVLGARRGHLVWIGAESGIYASTILDIDPEG